MISFNCPNCGNYIGGTMLHKVQEDVDSCDARCANVECGSIYRITMILLHPGQPVKRFKYVSDIEHNPKPIEVPLKQQSISLKKE